MQNKSPYYNIISSKTPELTLALPHPHPPSVPTPRGVSNRGPRGVGRSGGEGVRLKFRLRFYDSRNTLRNQVEKKQLGAFGPGPSTEFRCGSCCDSHFSWRHHIYTVLSGGVETHSKTPTREIIFKIQYYSSGWWSIQYSIF